MESNGHGGFDEQVCSKCHQTSKQGHAKNCPYILSHAGERLARIEGRLDAVEKMVQILETLVVRGRAKPPPKSGSGMRK